MNGGCPLLMEALFNCSNMYDGTNPYDSTYATCVEEEVNPVKVRRKPPASEIPLVPEC